MNAQSNGQGPDEQASARASEHEQPKNPAAPAASTDAPAPAESAEAESQREFDWRLMASKRLEEAPAPVAPAESEKGWRLEGGEPPHEAAPAHETAPAHDEPLKLASADEIAAARQEFSPPPGEPPYGVEPPFDEPSAKKPRRRVLLPLAAVLGVGLIGGGVYMVLSNGGLQDPFTPPVDGGAAKSAAEKPIPVQGAFAANSESVKSDATPPAAVHPDSVKPSEGESPAAKPDAETAAPAAPVGQNEAPSAKDAGSAAGAGHTAENAEPAPEAPAAKDADRPAETAAPSPKAADSLPTPAPAEAEAGQSASLRALIDQLTETRTKLVEAQAQASQAQDQASRNEAQLTQAQAQLAALTQRLGAAEAKLDVGAGMKAPAAPDLAPLRSAEAAARLALAEQTLAAFSHNGDAAPLVSALESLGGDPARVAQMRAGATAPVIAALTEEFVKLGPEIIAAAAPPAPAAAHPPAGNGLRELGERALSYFESHAGKLVRVRPASSAAPGDSPQDQAARRVATAVKFLKAGDLAGAVAEEELLPEPARAVAADWAKAANLRLVAEGAAKAEVEAALASLSKAKN